MKKIKRIIASLTTAVLLTGLAINFNACSEQSPLASVEDDAQGSVSLDKKGNANGQAGYPQFISRTYAFRTNLDGFQGGNMNVAGGSTFYLPNRSLTTPPGNPYGEDITLTMEVTRVQQKGKDMLEFNFGPHGCVFNPAATVTFDWTDLGIDVAQLYYIDESGNYIQQTPDDVDIQNNKMTLSLDHFSRYAIGAE